MAKIKCNHCKSKFVYKYGRSRNNDLEKFYMLERYSIVELDNLYYCKECMDRMREK